MRGLPRSPYAVFVVTANDAPNRYHITTCPGNVRCVALPYTEPGEPRKHQGTPETIRHVHAKHALSGCQKPAHSQHSTLHPFDRSVHV